MNFRNVQPQVERTISSVRALVTLLVLLMFMHLLYVLLQSLLADHNFSTALTRKLFSIVHLSPTHGNLLVKLDILVNIAAKAARLATVSVTQNKMFPQSSRVSRREGTFGARSLFSCVNMLHVQIKRWFASQPGAAKCANQLFIVVMLHNVSSQRCLLLGCERTVGTFVFRDDFMLYF